MFHSIIEEPISLSSGNAHYHQIQQQNTPELEPIHFYHATAYPFGSYADLVLRLAQEQARDIFGLAHRGCWNEHSGPQKDTEWEDYADDLIEFLEKKNCGPVVGIGHSIGAVTTMFAAIKRPELFSKLVLIDPVFVAPPIWCVSKLMRTINRPNPMAAVAKRRPNKWSSREQAVDFHRGKRAFSRFTDLTMEAYGHFGIKTDDEDFSLRFDRDWESHIYTTVPYIWRHLPKVNVPVLGLRGVHSDVINDKTWQRWGRMRPQDKLVALDKCGHLLPHEQPAECAVHIQEFLAN